jgi:hypothetical protein
VLQWNSRSASQKAFHPSTTSAAISSASSKRAAHAAAHAHATSTKHPIGSTTGVSSHAHTITLHDSPPFEEHHSVSAPPPNESVPAPPLVGIELNPGPTAGVSAVNYATGAPTVLRLLDYSAPLTPDLSAVLTPDESANLPGFADIVSEQLPSPSVQSMPPMSGATTAPDLLLDPRWSAYPWQRRVLTVLVVFIVLPPVYVLVRVLIQRFLGDGFAVKTLKALNSTLGRDSSELVECEELRDNLDFTTNICLTILTNASVLVSSVVNRYLLIAGMCVSFVASYLIFLEFFRARVNPASRVVWRTKVYWDLFCLVYDTAPLQAKLIEHIQTRLKISPLACGLYGYGRDKTGQVNDRFVVPVAERVKRNRMELESQQLAKIA